MTDILTHEQYLPSKEVATLIETLEHRPLRDKLFILVMLRTGARQIEVVGGLGQETINGELREKTYVGLRGRDVLDQAIYLQTAKGGPMREVPVDRHLIAGLRQYIREHNIGPDDRVFPFSRAWAREIWYKCRPGHCNKSLHKLRHTFATFLFENSKDLDMVQHLLGHTDLRSVRKYAHRDRARAAKKATRGMWNRKVS